MKLEKVIEHAQHVKENTGDFDTGDVLIVERGADLVSIVALPPADRDDRLGLVFKIGPAYAATALTLVQDAVFKTGFGIVPENYEHGDFTKQLEAGAKDVVECILVSRVEKVDDKPICTGALCPYTVIDDSLFWGDTRFWDPGDIEGPWVEAMKASIMHEPVLLGANETALKDGVKPMVQEEFDAVVRDTLQNLFGCLVK